MLLLVLVLRDVGVALRRWALIWTRARAGASAGVRVVVRTSWGSELGGVVWMLRVVRRVVIIVAIVLVEDGDGHWAGAGGLWDTSSRTSAIDATDAATLGHTHSIPFWGRIARSRCTSIIVRSPATIRGLVGRMGIVGAGVS